MTDIVNWPAVLEDVKEFFDLRTKSAVVEKERKNYCTDSSGDKYTLGIKNNKVVCMWIGNFRKDRIGRPKKDGTCTVFSVADTTAPFRYGTDRIKEGFTSREWDMIGKQLEFFRSLLT